MSLGLGIFYSCTQRVYHACLENASDIRKLLRGLLNVATKLFVVCFWSVWDSVFVYGHWCEENELVFVSHEVPGPKVTSGWKWHRVWSKKPLN